MITAKEVRLENAPGWYGTPFEKLDFEWTTEEKLEIERYCEKILKNVEEEEMTPLERWKAHMAGKPKDRKLAAVSTMWVYSTRSLDSCADALKPIDLLRNPKLFVKAYLATVARFKLDYPNVYIITHGEELWGGRAKAIDYGGIPCPAGDPPIKSLEDLEGLEIPDPWRDGLYPGYLWSVRELRRIIDKYNLPIPAWLSINSGAAELVMYNMMGWNPFMKALRKNPELAQRCCDLTQEFVFKLGRAVIDLAKPDGVYVCQLTGCYPLKGSEWIADNWAALAKFLKSYSPKPLHLSHGYSFLSGVFQWYDILHQRGAMTVDAFDGGTGGLSEDIDMNRVFEWHREHNIYLSYSIRNETIEKGPISAIEEEVKALSEFGMSHPKFAPGVIPVYWVPPAHVDAGVAALKKYNKC